MAKRREIRVAGASEPISHYTDAVRFGDLLFVSGIAPFDSDGEVVGEGDVVAQTRQVLASLLDALRTVGADMSDVLKVTVFLTDVNDRAAINPVRQEFFGDARPASTLVEVSALVDPRMLVEIEAVASIPEGGRTRAPDMNAETVARLCDAISRDSPEDGAAALARAELPFEPLDRTKRSRSDAEKVSVFLRDGFIDRYSGKRLVFPGTLLLLSQLLPEEIPYHSHWDTSKCHMVFWYLSPTVDHVDPVARGGPDTTDNLVCTSMPRNDAKRHWTLEELGWHPYPPASLLEWDGLLGWFMDYTSDEPSVLALPVLKKWRRAAERALATSDPGELPITLQRFVGA